MKKKKISSRIFCMDFGSFCNVKDLAAKAERERERMIEVMIFRREYTYY